MHFCPMFSCRNSLLIFQVGFALYIFERLTIFKNARFFYAFCPMFSCRNKARQIVQGRNLPPIIEKNTSTTPKSVLIKIIQQMDSGGTGYDPLQSAQSSDDGKSSESQSGVSSRVGQLFSSLTSAATNSITDLSPSHKLAAARKPPPLPTPLPPSCAISEGAASVGAKKLTKPRPTPQTKKMQQYPLPTPLCLPCPNYAAIAVLNNVLWATSLPSNVSDQGV